MPLVDYRFVEMPPGREVSVEGDCLLLGGQLLQEDAAWADALDYCALMYIYYLSYGRNH